MPPNTTWAVVWYSKYTLKQQIMHYDKVQCTEQTLKQCNKLWHSTGLQIHPETTNDALQQSAVY